MAIQEQETSLVPAQSSPVDGEYVLQVKDISAAGKVQELSVVLGNGSDFEKWNLMARAALLKRTTFQSLSLPEIIFAILYADKQGLDIVAGDVYMVNGRIATTNKAKIKHAMLSGRIDGIEVETAELEGVPVTLDGYVGNDLETTVTVTVKGWSKPYIHRGRLSHWYMKSNPNWKQRPAYMLELNTKAHALDTVAPLGGAEADEAPPVAETPLFKAKESAA